MFPSGSQTHSDRVRGVHMLPQNYKTVHRRFQTWCHEVLRDTVANSSGAAWTESESFIDR